MWLDGSHYSDLMKDPRKNIAHMYKFIYKVKHILKMTFTSYGCNLWLKATDVSYGYPTTGVTFGSKVTLATDG